MNKVLGNITVKLEGNSKKILKVSRAAYSLCHLTPMDEMECLQVENCIVDILHFINDINSEVNSVILIEITFKSEEDRIVIEFAESGVPVDPDVYMKGAVNKEQIVLKSRARGIGMLNEIMDEVKYVSSKDKNVLTLTKHVS